MSLDYELRIATDWQPKQILELLSNELNLEWEEESRLFGKGIVMGAIQEREGSKSTHYSTNIWISTHCQCVVLARS